MESGPLLWRKTQDIFQNYYCSPTFARNLRAFFGSSLWEPGEVPRSRTNENVWTSLRLGLQMSSLSSPYSASSNSSKLAFKCFHQFMVLAASAPGKLISSVILCIHLTSPHFEVVVGLITSILRVQEKFFLVCLAFFLL